MESDYDKFDEYVVKDILDALARYKKICKTCTYNKDGYCKRVSGKRINIKAINYCGLWNTTGIGTWRSSNEKTYRC